MEKFTYFRSVAKISSKFGIRTQGYLAHQLVWKSFPGIDHGTDAPFSFLVERSKDGVNDVIYLNSTIMPVDTNILKWSRISKIDVDMDQENVIQFTSLANVATHVDNKYVAIGNELEIRMWVKEKMKKIGCKLHTVDVSPRLDLSLVFSKRGCCKHRVPRRKIGGRITIENPDLFKDNFIRGIGPKKGIGCGAINMTPMKCETTVIK